MTQTPMDTGQPPQTLQQHDEGPRMRTLRQLFDVALANCLNASSYDRFAQAFPKLARDDPDALRIAREQTVDFIRNAMQEEFNDINTERNVGEHLNTLDRVIAAALASQKQHQLQQTSSAAAAAAAVSGTGIVNPVQAVRAHAVQAKRAEVERLKARLQSVENATTTYETTLTDLRTQTETLKDHIETGIASLLASRTAVDQLAVEATGGTGCDVVCN
ncbi:uncharacterized protein EV422DRAFT_16420 [Fimicolochytrium jonesii]|uniref:uncharacterized protein n=1 Tax=Fimicolochytrium jonesii TaxID=1396493 RepID=UPI0022FEDC38|nr:uncharacterized protein EV422DRAFT_16420 [Fimicolochytrium jonesii]KAI8826885.1 hypothetical protein EV422DRAFT_16420 [Fimicolochytrium jonesii]